MLPPRLDDSRLTFWRHARLCWWQFGFREAGSFLWDHQRFDAMIGLGLFAIGLARNFIAAKEKTCLQQILHIVWDSAKDGLTSIGILAFLVGIGFVIAAPLRIDRRRISRIEAVEKEREDARREVLNGLKDIEALQHDIKELRSPSNTGIAEYVQKEMPEVFNAIKKALARGRYEHSRDIALLRSVNNVVGRSCVQLTADRVPNLFEHFETLLDRGYVSREREDWLFRTTSDWLQRIREMPD